MKLVFLGPRTVHTVKWANEMARRGHEVYLLTLHNSNEPLEPTVKFIELPLKPPFGFYLNAPFLKYLLKKIKPDLLNTHYASSYGTLARLSGFHPNLLSVWGSDVFEFPYLSKFNMRLIRKNICEADRVASTSKIMKRQVESLWRPKSDITVTPFGIDCSKFSPVSEKGSRSGKLRIGTVKSLSPQYGIMYLIKAFALAKDNGLKDAELCIVGGGSQEKELKKLTFELGIQNDLRFTGSVPSSEVPQWLNSFDIYVALSIQESFGVAVLEASACNLPVIVSNAGGLPEVVVDGVTGFIVPTKDYKTAAEKILEMSQDPELREKLGKKGREFVVRNYEWSECANVMEQLYREVIQVKKI